MAAVARVANEFGEMGCAAHAGAVVVLAPALFTNSAEVITVMGSMLPLMCLRLVIHTASMATEGMLLAGAARAGSRSHLSF